ncbi:MAG TPA: hypothetical protein VM618_13340 [Acidimicrobiia bacterium]|nr:hypothetical protein [Acidimicrobiia bacterium]
MTGSEVVRHRVFDAFQRSHGVEVASDLMELLPPAGLPELATKQDLAVLKADLVGEFRSEVGSVRNELGFLRGDVAAEFASVRSDMAVESASLRAELAAMRAELKDSLLAQTNRYVRWMFGAIVISTVIATAASAIVDGRF